MAKFKKNFDWNQIEKDNQEVEEIIIVSKSEIKRDAAIVKKFVYSLLEVSNSILDKIDIDESIKRDIIICRSFGFEAKRREVQNISKRLRKYDFDFIQSQLDKFNSQRFNSSANVKIIEKVFEKIINNQKIIMGKISIQYPELDLDKLNLLVNNYKQSNDIKYKTQIISVLQQHFK